MCRIDFVFQHAPVTAMMRFQAILLAVLGTNLVTGKKRSHTLFYDVHEKSGICVTRRMEMCLLVTRVSHLEREFDGVDLQTLRHQEAL